MDVLTLLDEAKRAGVIVRVVNGDIEIEAEPSQRELVSKLRSHKADIVLLLGSGANGVNDQIENG